MYEKTDNLGAFLMKRFLKGGHGVVFCSMIVGEESLRLWLESQTHGKGENKMGLRAEGSLVESKYCGFGKGVLKFLFLFFLCRWCFCNLVRAEASLLLRECVSASVFSSTVSKSIRKK